MKRLFTIEDKLSNKISFYHLAFFLVMLPFDRFYSQLVLISFTIHTLLQLRRENFRQIPFKTLIISQSVFLLTLVGIFYSNNTGQAGSMLSRQLAIFLFPLLFALSSLDLKKYLPQLLLFFSVSCAVTILYLYVDAFRIILYNKLPLSAIASDFFINHNFSSPIDMHATYLSLYAGLCLLFLIGGWPAERFGKHEVLRGIAALILLAGLVQLASRTVFFTTLVCAFIVLPALRFSGAQKKKLLISGGSILVLLTILINSLPGLRSRFLDDLRADLGQSKNYTRITEPRMQRWKLAAEIIQEKPVFGHGSGDEVDLLKEKYFENKLYKSFLLNLNAHNQYLSMLIRFGAIGLIIFLMAIWYGTRLALREKDTMFLCFMLLMIMLAFSENFLDVNKGIFFYGFFFPLFLFMHQRHPHNQKSADSTPKKKTTSIY